MSTAPTESPRFLGRYELVHPLGQGGMGEVFLAKISGAAGFEKPCIVKTILPALLKDRQFLDRFHHEAKVLVHLVHSSIAQVYDMGEADGTYYMALEYVAGVDLAYLLEQARAQGVAVPVPVALFIGQRMAEGLGYAHRKVGTDGTPLGIVHRDVSPHNVMVSYEGEVKVIDFGLAKSAARSKYTLPSTVMGKLGYMSPEQVRAEPLDHRSDIYSSGVVVWEMLAGRPLIPHGTVGEMMAAMSQPVVPSLSEARPEVDAALESVVRRALEAKPDTRYSRSDEWARALNGELVRTGAAVGAEEVGNFVRALCPEAFASQRKLISKVSSSSGHHRTPTPAPTSSPGTGTGMYGTGPQAYGTGPQAAEEGVSGYDSTVLRSTSDSQPPARQSGGVARPDAVYADGEDADLGATTLRQPSGTGMPPARAGSGGQAVRKQSRPVPSVVVDEEAAEALAERVARKRPMGLYAAIAVLLVIATAAITALFVRQPEAPALVAQPLANNEPGAPAKGHEATGSTGTASATGTPGAAPATGTASATGTPGTAPATGTATGTADPAHGTGTPSTGAVAAGGQGTPTAEAVPSSGSVAAGSATPDKTEPAEPATPDKHPTSTTAKVPGKKKTPTTSAQTPAPEPKVRYVSPSVVLPVSEDSGRHYVEKGWAAGLVEGAEVLVVGAPAKNGQRPVVGLARVQKTGGRGLRKLQKTFLELDDAALASTGTLYVAVPEGKAAALGQGGTEGSTEDAPVEAPTKPKKQTLYASVAQQTGVASFTSPGIKVRNLGVTPWTECTVVKDRRNAAWLGNVEANEEKYVNEKRFKMNTAYDVGSNNVGIYCNEGEVVMPLR
ncbi:protein kinase [Pyxidicoccus parkwayensis]|uniref:Protein kinase n=1 Tax=Pyxidicoccus parkwayensis TaxID=2813578 RepID=A0ABX7NSQ7_9BACT|nr:serine/threonine protein kinase [Pyxidicoccus parkwaysis]QSQ21815.1 protein kinase [Pyxidicoccus parkwaysis]